MNAEPGAVDRGRVPPTRPDDFGPPDALRTIVTRPRATMRWVLDHGDGGLWAWLLAGAILTLAAPIAIDASRALGRPPFSLSAPWSIFAFATVRSIVGTGCFLAGAVLVARGMGGVGSVGDTLRALAWGGLPLAGALPFAVGSAFFDPARAPLPFVLLRLLGLAAAVLSGVLTVATFAEAQRFSWRRATLALALALALAYGLGVVVTRILPHLVAVVPLGRD